MNFQDFIFYFFSGVLVLSALGVITLRNPVYAALLLVLAFFTSAGIWLLLEAEFLAITLVLVYVGAVMVLFLFVVMMLDINVARMREGFIRYLPIGVFVAVLMVTAMGLVVSSDYFQTNTTAPATVRGPDYSNTTELGRALYTDYLYPFEIAGVILLVAIIAAIALTMRKPRSTKTQQPSKQVQARKEDRLKIIKMQSEQQQQ